MCDQAVALMAALHPWPYSTTVLPTHTVTAGGRVSEEAESKAEGKEGKGEGGRKCFSESDVWESNERPSSNPVAKQPE